MDRVICMFLSAGKVADAGRQAHTLSTATQREQSPQRVPSISRCAPARWLSSLPRLCLTKCRKLALLVQHCIAMMSQTIEASSLREAQLQLLDDFSALLTSLRTLDPAQVDLVVEFKGMVSDSAPISMSCVRACAYAYANGDADGSNEPPHRALHC
jgi:hypothetical protein